MPTATLEERIEVMQSQLLELACDVEDLMEEGYEFEIIEDIGSYLYRMVSELDNFVHELGEAELVAHNDNGSEEDHA
jgi:hypothetical protein